MNNFNLNEFSTTSESDSEYLVDSRYCRTTVKCKRKALKKTIKLIHGRCVVIYRGSGDLLPIAAKDADRNCYCDFVFVCHDPRPIKQIRETSTIPRSGSAIRDSSTSDDDDQSNNNIFQKRSIHPLYNNQKLLKQNSFLFQTNINENNNNEMNNSSITIEEDLLMKTKKINDHLILEEIDLDVDELLDVDEPSPSIIYFPSSRTKNLSNIITDTC